MIKVTEEFVEAVVRREMLVEITLVVFAELPSCVALLFEHGSNAGVGFLPALCCPRHADLRHPGADGHIATKKCGTTCRTRLLSVVVGEGNAFFCDAIDVRRLVAQHAAVVVADVPGADIVAPDNEDVWLVRGFCPLRADN